MTPWELFLTLAAAIGGIGAGLALALLAIAAAVGLISAVIFSMPDSCLPPARFDPELEAMRARMAEIK